jgi:hypothetical protein
VLTPIMTSGGITTSILEMVMEVLVRVAPAAMFELSAAKVSIPTVRDTAVAEVHRANKGLSKLTVVAEVHRANKGLSKLTVVAKFH